MRTNSLLEAIFSEEQNRAMAKFEDSLKKLEAIVAQLEEGDLALEDSLKLFEDGVNLSAACKQELDAAEGKVQMLVKQRDGSQKLEPFLTES
jgi:exodeoxyribonuclease VII small subunit